MKKQFLSFLLLSASAAMTAQTAVSIQQIQDVSPQNLAACVDSSSYKGQMVSVKGTVVMPFGLAVNGSGATQLRNIWIQNGTGGFSGLDVFDSNSADIDNLVAGDSVEIIGSVTEFGPTGGPQVETELSSITTINILGTNRPVNFNTINIGDLNDATQVNLLPTGEQWEGSFVELQNVTVTAVVPFANGTRVSFNVVDANGNMINVSDRFKAQKLPAAGGNFVPPTVGTQYASLKGILMHSPNGCLNFNGRGYELHPFDFSHYGFGTVVPPQISAITANPLVPTSSQTVTISANITDPNAGGSVVSATLYYAVGVSNTTYTSVPMTASGNTWSATVPAQADNSFVKYYICATDNDTLTACQTNVPNNANPFAYVVKDNGLNIYDVQYTPFTDGNSIFKDKTVTLTGIVTASAEPGNLGYVFMQQEGGLLGWAGIMCIGNPQLASLKIGDKVTATGDIKESFGYTRLENITSLTVNGSGSINPLNLDPTVFSTYDFATNEAYEGMLVRITKQGASGPLYVVDNNPDAPGNFAEYRIGEDALAPADGCRIIAGRQTSSAYSSLNVSYVNDVQWVPNAGVAQTVVQYNDCVSSVTGIIYYSFSNVKMMPRNNDDFVNYWVACVNSIESGLISQVEVKAFPSPASETLKVSYKFPQNWAATAQLFDVNGRVVATQSFDGAKGELSFDLNPISSGVYFLQIVSDNTQVYSGKVNVVK